MSRFSVRLPEEWERQILAPLAHQGAMPDDQFARLFGYSPAEAEEVIAHLVSSGYAKHRELLADEPPWTWLTGPGTRISGTGLNAQYNPTPASLARLRAVNEARLFLAEKAPHARWTSHRALQHLYGGSTKAPSALVEIADERHAIEVRLNHRNLPYFCEMVEARLSDYDAVVVFCLGCTPKPYERLVRRHGWRRVIIRTLPGENS